eukprot:TRINITY_DN11387_c0_g1_i1.p1 TRINITY_DN11387_c0_g1~~TRINITY_DN11387_c0_g1_i1.p1  ORF type:complete len:1190 (+),score=256.88 TRINITY_DN11387_c0_g1_i1:416-3571(+)
MTKIDVSIDAKAGSITVMNDGFGIPVQMHASEKVFVPQLVMGNLLTGSNFDDSEAKVTGGRSGYGAKLANIFSKSFTIETADTRANLLYKQTWRDNMSVCEAPVVTPLPTGARDYTKITYCPDLSRFGMSTFDNDSIAVLKKRVFDIAATVGPQVGVTWNAVDVPVRGFEDLIRMYEPNSPISTLRVNDRWQVALASNSGGTFQQVSFVNSVATTKGGTHVSYIADQIAKSLAEHISKKHKATVSATLVKSHMSLFVSCLIENPAFDSQTKETLTTKPQSFGSTCLLPDKTIYQWGESTGLVEEVLTSLRAKQQRELVSKTSVRSKTRLLGIPKLDDANEAGAQWQKCTLILTEGDSAKALAVAGLGVLGRDHYGVFPLKGKMLNVRDASHKQIIENAEIANIVKILGLDFSKKYEDPAELQLRYGRVMLMTDQDYDGSHIKGLFINMIAHFWPALLQRNGFLEEFITPIVKVSKGAERKSFFTVPEYEAFMASLAPAEASHWHSKYYKGLGTNTAQEGREYFSNLAKHRIPFVWNGAEDASLINMAFSKHTREERKQWLLQLKDGTHVDHSQGSLSYQDFINKELVLFSSYDNVRSIPSLVDGLKHGQRKVLFGCFKRKLSKEVKVAQLSGYVSEHTAYHHGEVSLHSTIINMAQNFVGSNNLPLLAPIGQFGTRLAGGRDSASARYIFTRLQPWTRRLFHEDDDTVLQYRQEDGETIEPVYFVPILPTVLVNGAEGVGTGWSTSIPTYSPLQIIDNIERKLADKPMVEMTPYVRGFRGQISPTEGGYITSGIARKLDATTVEITELPVGRWTEDYKETLDGMMQSKSKYPIRGYTEHHSDDRVKFVVQLSKSDMQTAESAGLNVYFKLHSTVNTTNMHLFNAAGVITKYTSPVQIIEEFIPVRLQYYTARKQYLTDRLRRIVERLQNKERFVSMVISGELKLNQRPRKQVLQDLLQLKFVPLEHVSAPSAPATVDDGVVAVAVEERPSPERGYDYLLQMPLSSLTAERVSDLQKERGARASELTLLQATSEKDMWKADLAGLRNVLPKE